mmetsp:Transcript_11387/g.20452  ORF Transcript_11387/g.20452 Transcript_11387/m.20452 type:complete len:224 (+) Transcript_11387:1320-1991(+)
MEGYRLRISALHVPRDEDSGVRDGHRTAFGYVADGRISRRRQAMGHQNVMGDGGRVLTSEVEGSSPHVRGGVGSDGLFGDGRGTDDAVGEYQIREHQRRRREGVVGRQRGIHAVRQTRHRVHRRTRQYDRTGKVQVPHRPRRRGRYYLDGHRRKTRLTRSVIPPSDPHEGLVPRPPRAVGALHPRGDRPQRFAGEVRVGRDSSCRGEAYRRGGDDVREVDGER